ncbi:hypothetical protein P175DRAFT_0501728 [Aspergillus ochraceoroseus IBT 24754]|uniref:Secreted protein n=1 Tax=Aspergillus ochraceoroseus IBT 24754 TaxID=1392256 RepID=A0A2T5LXX3_9EURO|nr:uncharacterized protein P175DRAFT_0501728 [Aspergillus ochraceoroseus IBT 24754]PTU21093.1 hypothetical protein P175DRAFT_0501728 [Aspergillus ochraceoroseus IBT 24754]
MTRMAQTALEVFLLIFSEWAPHARDAAGSPLITQGIERRASMWINVRLEPGGVALRRMGSTGLRGNNESSKG